MSFAKKEYEFLGELDISPRNLGCYVNGKWKASGPVVSTSNPATNQAIAEVVEGSIEDYEEGLRSCAEAAKVWMQVTAIAYEVSFGVYIFRLNCYFCNAIAEAQVSVEVCAILAHELYKIKAAYVSSISYKTEA